MTNEVPATLYTSAKETGEALNPAAGRVVEQSEAQAPAAGPNEDTAIVKKVLEGDTQAFAGLVERYKGAVFNLCYRMLNNPAEAEDAAQEVFVRAYTQLRTYQPGRKFSTWILSIANHYCIDVLRRRRAIMVDLETVAFQEESKQPEPEEQVMTQETRGEVRNLLDKLPEKYRAVTVLRYWEDLSYDEIAEATGLTVATVKTRLFRARELLARELAEQQKRAAHPAPAPEQPAKPKATARRTGSHKPRLAASRASLGAVQ